MKICSKCKNEYELSNFNKSNTHTDGLSSQCKSCIKIRTKRYYLANREKKCKSTSESRIAARKKNKRFIGRIKRLGCSKCLEKSPECIDFHHLKREEKYKEICWLVQKGYRLEVIKTELRKCIRVCANCHRKIHAGTVKV